MNRGVFFGIACLCALVVSGLFFTGYLGQVQRTLTDNVYGGGVASKDILVVAIDDASLQEIGRWPWDREVMAAIIGRLSSARVVGVDVAFFEPAPGDAVLAQALSDAGNVVLAMEYGAFEPRDGGVAGTSALFPVEVLRNASKGVGYINILTDRDGVTRAYNTNILGDVESFAVEVAQMAYGKPIERKSRFMINFVGPPGSFGTLSARDVLADDFDESLVRSKVVLIGATSPDLHDTFFVPTSDGRAMPGVEILANAVQSMVLENDVREQSALAVVLSIFACSLLVALGFVFLRMRTVFVVALAAGLLYVLSAVFVFEAGVLLNVLYPPLGIVGSAVGCLTYAYVAGKKQRDEAVNALSKYVSADVVGELLKDPSKLRLGGVRRTITVFFSDIRGFTGISEVLSAEELVHLLNEYLTEMTDIAIDEQGTVDKYMGDAIMAFWGAPVEHADHAVRACRASLRMMARLKELQTQWSARKIPILDVGIGLNTGEAVVGNMGSHQRFDYTAMGDTVNLGSRLEGVNKEYGTHILLSESTKKLVEGEFVVRLVDRIKVKGRDAPLLLYELVGEQVSEEVLRALALFEGALEHYFSGEWDLAMKEFNAVRKVLPSDGPSKVFIDRCEFYKKSPPPPGWDGVWVLKTK